MTRARYPETVPFRLTRMLIHAMEGGGLEGTCVPKPCLFVRLFFWGGGGGGVGGGYGLA